MRLEIAKDHESVVGNRIKENAFRFNADIEEVVIGEGIQDIGQGAFFDCSSLRKVVLPDGLKEIGDETFHECPNLRTINLPESLNGIGYDAFSDGGELNLFRIPRGVTRMGKNAFRHGDAKRLRAAAVPCPSWSPRVGVAPDMEIALHETGHGGKRRKQEFRDICLFYEGFV